MKMLPWCLRQIFLVMIESLMGMEEYHGNPNIEDYDVEDYDEILSRQLFTYFELNDKGM